MTDRRREEKPACSVKAAPFPTEVSCPDCGREIEVWSDEDGTTCNTCGTFIHNRDCSARQGG